MEVPEFADPAGEGGAREGQHAALGGEGGSKLGVVHTAFQTRQVFRRGRGRHVFPVLALQSDLMALLGVEALCDGLGVGGDAERPVAPYAHGARELGGERGHLPQCVCVWLVRRRGGGQQVVAPRDVVHGALVPALGGQRLLGLELAKAGHHDLAAGREGGVAGEEGDVAVIGRQPVRLQAVRQLAGGPVLVADVERRQLGLDVGEHVEHGVAREQVEEGLAGGAAGAAPEDRAVHAVAEDEEHGVGHGLKLRVAARAIGRHDRDWHD
jgi:hypothetical protein